MNRIVKLVVALVLTTSGLLVLGGTPGAQATQHRVVQAGAAAPAAPAAVPAAQRAAKPARTIVLVTNMKQSDDGFRLKAGIRPNFRSRVAILQYKRKVTGTFQRIRTARSNDAGVVRFPRKVRKLGYYRAITQEDALYVRSASNIIRIKPCPASGC